MNEKRTIFGFLAEMLVIFAVGILFLSLVSCFTGESAQAESSLFSLGEDGLSNAVLWQFLLCSFVLELLKEFWLGSFFIKKMMMFGRIIWLLLSIIAEIAVFSSVFGWFAIDSVSGWGGFLLSFAVFFGGSILCMTVKTKLENKRVAEGLAAYRQKKGIKDDE